MKNLIQSTTDFAMNTVRSYIDEFIKSGQLVTALDATCGNGHDTLSLLQAGASTVYAFDVQESAIDNTKALTAPFAQKVHVIQDSHVNMKNYCSEASIVIFNLGYLPGGNKELTTDISSTLQALKAALDILQIGGLVSIAMYSGHPSGAIEKAELLAFASKLDSSIYHVAYVSMLNQHRNPPEILFITRKR